MQENDRIQAEQLLLRKLAEGEESAQKEGWVSADDTEKILRVAEKQNFVTVREAHQLEVRNMVLDGLKQVDEGKTNDFNGVCDRLEQKYKDILITDLQRAEERADREGWIDADDLEKELINRIDDAIYESEQEMVNGAEAIDADVVFAELDKKYF